MEDRLRVDKSSEKGIIEARKLAQERMINVFDYDVLEDELVDVIGTAKELKNDSFDAKGYTMADFVDKYEHSIIEDICEMLGVEYKRWKKS